jgi:hypothetical protein
MRFTDYVSGEEQTQIQYEVEEMLYIPTKKSGMSMDKLEHVEFPPTRWIIETILPVGCYLLVARPKMKKSWMALGWSFAVAMGTPAMGKLQTDRGEVLYLDLDSASLERFQNRARIMLGNGWPSNMHVYTSWASGEDALKQLDDWMTNHPDTRLIVVDVLYNLRGSMGRGADRYEDDMKVLQSYSHFARRHGIAMVLVHHTRKMTAVNPFDETAGSTGLLGGGDGTLMLRNTSKGANLILQGRDIDYDEPLPLRWEKETCSWFIVDQDEMGKNLCPLQEDILNFIGSSQVAISMQDIYTQFPERKRATLQSYVSRLCDAGVLERAEMGRYAVV